MLSPTHPKTRSYFQRGLFDGLTSFRELEGRISGLATKGERGAAFEVFAEAYLAAVAVEKAKHVWPGASVPHSLRKRLALTIGDKGVDGIFETQLGEHHAYQAKFRTGRPSLTWDELSTFIGLADRVEQRVLFTNCDRFADVVKQRTGFYAITGNDLDKLELQDFAVIRAWLEGASVARQPKAPLPHQAEALNNILSALRDQNRAMALMACGTGKTLVALWIAERMGAQNTLVLVPSLALLRQTLHEWACETSWRSFAHLCVCSDPTVKPDSDEIILHSSDLDFPVTTDSAQVRAFLAAKFDGVKLVFCTYQSAHVVAAGMKQGDAFDLAIFDEAHKTAGREGVHFGFALNDKNLSISKRLFLTATPRHYDVRKRDKEGDARLVYSMDAPEVYGRVAHKLTFAEAARRAIICNYKVIISVVTSDIVNDHLLRHGEVIVKGHAVKARHVANQLALQAAVAQHGVSKIFTFHRSVASAAAFTSDGAEGIGNHLSGFDAFHVNGSMPTSERENIMAEFRAASKAVISNAKCLTEGVDVPAVDMVAFLTPKRSRVDIVQATGRAMRKDPKDPDKMTGYILVPLFVEEAKGEAIEEALARTEFDEVWNVLQAMQEQDHILATAIKEMREERGRTKGFDDTRFREKVEVIGPQVSLDALRDSITTACIEAIGDNWEEHFGELKAFKEQHGHCDVPIHRSKNPKFASWVNVQRTRKKQGLLRYDRVERLEKIGFIFDALAARWENMFAALVDYRTKYRHCNVPYEWPENRQLATWVLEQRAAKRRRILSEERFLRLEGIGFRWDAPDTWEGMFSALVEYKRKHGDCNVPYQYSTNQELGRWVANQRARRDWLNAERVKKLESIGFIWNAIDAQWEEMFTVLLEYKHRNGDCNVPMGCAENPDLSRWIHRQRQAYKTQTLGEDRAQRLNALGFSWAPHEALWEQNFRALSEFKREHGHCLVRTGWRENPQLATWVTSQRHRGGLSADRKRRLAELGFVWDPRDAYWEEMFAALIDYKRSYGNCNVPITWKKNRKLARWVFTVRRAKKTASMRQDRIERLDAIGFEWSVDR